MRFIDRVYKNINRSLLPDIRRKLIASTSFLVLLLITVNLLLFYITTRENYVKKMESSNENLIKQISFSYEMVLNNVKNAVYKTTLIDEHFIELVQNYNNSFDHRKDIFNKLYGITLINEYIQSAYLYIPGYNQIFSTSNNSERISSYEAFSDKEAFSMIHKRGHYTLEPRIVKYNGTKKQILSIVSSVPLYNQQNLAFLVVNVDLDKLRYNILVKFKKNQNINFYIVNNENSVIITDNATKINLGTVVKEELYNKISYIGSLNKFLNNNIVFTSVYYSKSLKWKFVLENYIDASTDNSTTWTKKFLWFITVSILLLIMTLVILIIIITIFTKPISKILIKYKEKIWKDFITDNIYLTEEVKAQLFDEQFGINAEKYGIIMLHIEHSELLDEIVSYCKSELSNIINSFKGKNGLKIKVINTNKNSFTIIISYPNTTPPEQCDQQQIHIAQMIYGKINPIYRATVYLAISTIKEQIDAIPSLYRECIEVLKYKLTYNSHLLNFSIIKNKQDSYEYPHDLERQLLNNISAGNIESCRQILNKFFLLFNKPDTRVEDNVIKRSIRTLKEAILNNIKKPPISVENTIKIDISNLNSIDKIRVSFIEFVERLCSEIVEKHNDEKSKLYNKVLDYIEKHYTLPDISLNKIADAMDINKNYVSKIVSETTGKGFNDYINYKRITLAKKLLQDKNKTIKDIAEEVGFNYSYYFIKIFKSIEGITPGQYRDSFS